MGRSAQNLASADAPVDGEEAQAMCAECREPTGAATGTKSRSGQPSVLRGPEDHNTDQRSRGRWRSKMNRHNTRSDIMPLFVNQVGQKPNDDDDDDDSSDEDIESSATKRVKDLESTLAAVSSQEFERLPYPIIVDSGAAESVLPSKRCPQAQLMKSEQQGKDYSAANGSTIKNQGCKVVSAATREGQWKHMTFQVAKVTKALASVSEMCAHISSYACSISCVLQRNL